MLSAIIGLTLLGVFSCETPNTEVARSDQDPLVIQGKYIVIFNTEAVPSGRMREPVFTDRDEKTLYSARVRDEVSETINAFLDEKGVSRGDVERIYTAALSGFVANLSDAQADRLRKDPRVFTVEPDRIVQLDPVIVEDVSGDRQPITCAVTNAGGPGSGSTRSTWIWVVDSGIDLDHPDLNVVTSTTYARSFVGGSADDCNGHGTHVAGIAAAYDNTIGVAGVSAGARVVPVRVFGCSGGSSTSTILSGINHVASYDIAGDVMNLSLGGYYGSGCSTGSSYITAINNVANGGTHVSIAAGNSAANAALYQPACINGTRIYTVASMTCSKTFASSYSNFGAPPIDWIATGSSVYSTYLNGGYATLTGTSMAAPVVAGILHQRNGAPVQCGTVSYGGVSYRIACR